MLEAPASTLPTSRPIRSLKELRAPVESELRAFDQLFRDSVRSPVGLLDTVTQYLLRQKGKQIRPLLVLLSAKACGGVTEASYRGAALVELLHTATLVHDDVVDDAERRRGMFSINAVWKNKVAVLLGDFLLSRGLQLSLEHQDYEFLHILSNAVQRIMEGELLQIKKTRKLNIDEPTYFRIIADKTASLIAACTTVGALSATADREMVDRMRTMGEKMGMAFQIRDDLFDFGVRDVGKPIGIDLQEKKMTLPLIESLRRASSRERKQILGIVKKKKKGRKDIAHVREFVEGYGGLAYAREHMHRFADEAYSELAGLPETDARTALEDLIGYIVKRDI